MARVRLLSSADAPQLTQTRSAKKSGTAAKRVTPPAVSPDEMREKVLALLRENPHLAPRNAEEKALTAAQHADFRRPPAETSKTFRGGAKAARGRPAVTPGTTPGTPSTKSGGSRFPSAVSI